MCGAAKAKCGTTGRSNSPCFFFSSRRRHTRCLSDWSSDVCSSDLYQITPFGNRGNYFVDQNQHAYRQQWIADLFLPTIHLRGEHQLKFGIDFEREAFHQQVVRHDYEVLNDDNSVARYVSFQGSPFQARKNFEDAQYVQDHWRSEEHTSELQSL